MKTRFTELVKIQYPIMQGAMQWLGVPELAAAVSNAGGLGTINASCYADPDSFQQAIQKLKKLTNKPFAINISLTPDATIGEAIIQNIEIAGQEKVAVIETSGSSPAGLRPLIQKTGALHIHKCTSLKHSLKAQSIGVDAVSVVGYEGAGHPSPFELGSFVLFNDVAKGLSIPVLAAGGIADGKGLAAALALGADGVVVGTRFVASNECLIHRNFKEVIVRANIADTITCQRNIKNMCRYYGNSQAMKALDAERRNASLAETLPLVSGKLSKVCYETGDTENCCFSIGQSAGLVSEIQTAEEIITSMVKEAKYIFNKFSSL